MAVGKKFEAFSLVPARRHEYSFRRKRVVLSNENSTTNKNYVEDDDDDDVENSPLEALPQDILIRIICGVDHDDLRALFQVSKTIQDATLVAKRLHFEYRTPKKTLGHQNKIHKLGDFGEFNEIEAPNAPRQSRVAKPRLINKKLVDISVALFTSDDDDMKWPRKQLLLEMKAPIFL